MSTAADQVKALPRNIRGSPMAPKDVGVALTMLGLCMFTATIVTARIPLGEIGIVIALIGMFLGRAPIFVSSATWFYVAFLLWSCLGSFYALEPEVARADLFERLKFAVIFVVVVNALRTDRQLRFYLLFLLTCFMVYPARGTIQNYFFTNYNYHGRVVWNSNYSNPNDLGALCGLAAGVALTFSYSVYYKLSRRVIAAMCALILVAIMLLTQSRGVAIGLVAGIGVGFVMAMFRRSRNIVIGVVLVMALSLAVPTKVWDRLSGISKLTSTSTIKEADKEGSAAERYEIQKTAWRIATDNPVLGVGLGNYPIANKIYSPRLGARDTHDTYLNLWAEAGLPGLLLWSAFVVSVLRSFHKSNRSPSKAGHGLQLVWIERAVIGFLVSGIFGSYSAQTMPYLLLGVLSCSAVLTQMRSAQELPAATGSP